MEIIMNEYTYTENLLAQKKLTPDILGSKPSSTLNMLARYYREIGFQDNEIKIKLDKFLHDCLGENYKSSKWIDCISHQIKRSKKYSLKKIDFVNVTKSEMAVIQQVKSKPCRKVLFTLLVIAKFYNAVSETNNNWTNLENRKIFKIANVHMSVKEQGLLIHKLYEGGLVNLSQKIGKPNIAVNFINNDSDVAVSITKLKDLGNEYLLFCGENYSRCERCGSLFYKKSNNQTKCKECQGYKKLNTKTLVCTDCGRKFEVNSRNTKSIRCNNCQVEHIKRYDTERKKLVKS